MTDDMLKISKDSFQNALATRNDHPTLACRFMSIALDTMPQGNISLHHIENALALANYALTKTMVEARKDCTAPLDLFDAISCAQLASPNDAAVRDTMLQNSVHASARQSPTIAWAFLEMARYHKNETIEALARPFTITPAHTTQGVAACH